MENMSDFLEFQVSMGWLEEAKKTGKMPAEASWPSLSMQRWAS